MRESTIERAACKYAKDNGVTVLKLGGPANRGKPDRLFLKDGKILFCEFKAPNKKPTAIQRKWIEDLRAQGFRADWCDNLHTAIALITETLLR